jgi:hypothetical protein
MAHEHEVTVADTTFGIVAEFDDPDALLAATHRARHEGYTHIEAYSPFPIHGLSDALEKGKFDDWRVPWFAFFGGLAGCITGFLGLYYVNVVDYPLNVGGKPLLSWPQFMPVTYECTILFAAGATFLSCWALNGLPKYYHPIFNAKNFDRASQDRFFLLVEKTDPKFDTEQTGAFLRHLNGVLDVSEVEK